MKRKKKMLSAFLAVSMLLTMLPTAAFADEYGSANQIEETVFSTPQITGENIQAKINEASNSALTLDGDISTSTTITINKNFTLNLNGYKINYTGSGYALKIEPAAGASGSGAAAAAEPANITVNIQGGTSGETKAGISSTSGGGIECINATVTLDEAAVTVNGMGVRVMKNSNVTVDSDSSVTSSNGVGVFICGSSDSTNTTAYRPTLNVQGSVTGGTNYAAIQGNGNDIHSTSIINISNGAEVTGTGNGDGIYLPQPNTTTISSGTITGYSGIAMKSGTLNITGGTIKGTGTYVSNLGANSSGINTDGSAIVVDSNSAYAGNININISNGTLQSDHASIVREFNASGTGSACQLKKLTITGGTFKSEREPIVIGSMDAASAPDVQVSNGDFDKPVNPDYLAGGYKYVVVKGTDREYYSTFEEAKNHATGENDRIYASKTPEIVSLGFNSLNSAVQSAAETIKTDIKSADTVTAVSNALYFGILGTEEATYYTAAVKAGTGTTNMTAVASNENKNKVVVVPLGAANQPALQSGTYTVTLFQGNGTSGDTYGTKTIDIYEVNYNTSVAGVSAPSTQYVVSGGSITLPGVTRSGYTFVGWKTSPDASATLKSYSTYTPTAVNTTLYAEWSKNDEVELDPDSKPTITFNTSVSKEDEAALKPLLEKSTYNLGDMLMESDIRAELNAVVSEVKKDIDKAMGSSLKAQGYTSVDVVPYLNMVVKDYVKTGSDKHLTLDITPMYRLNATGPNGMYTVVPNSQTQIKSEVNASVLMNIVLPEDFSTSSYAYIEHKDYIDRGNISDLSDGTKRLSYINRRGFSEFVIYAENPSEAYITGNGATTNYKTLQKAIDAVPENATLTIVLLKKPAETAEVEKDVKLTLTPVNGLTISEADMQKLVKTDASRKITFNMNGKSGVFDISTIQYFSITVKSPSNGKVSVSPAKEKYTEGDKITVTVTPDTGYGLDQIRIMAGGTQLYPDPGKKENTYTFTMPAVNTSITVTFKGSADNVCAPYKDVEQDKWYHEGVHYMIENKLMTGTKENSFEPLTKLNRAMVVQILYVKENPTKPSFTTTTAFSDVTEDKWFADAVTWAYENKITAGYGEGENKTFKPNKNISREELVTMIYSYAGNQTVTGNTLADYPDHDRVSDWAQFSMAWAVQNGIVTGKPDSSDESIILLAPADFTTRAETAAMFYQYFTS